MTVTPHQLFNAPRCGAHSRRTGKPCMAPAMKNGRCRMHGGKSTGRPVIHGRYTKKAKASRREFRELMRKMREILALVS